MALRYLVASFLVVLAPAHALAYGNQKFERMVTTKPIQPTPLNFIVVRSSDFMPKSPFDRKRDFSRADANLLTVLMTKALYHLDEGRSYFKARVAHYRVVTDDPLTLSTTRPGALILKDLASKYGRKRQLNVFVVNCGGTHTGTARVNAPLGDHKNSSFLVAADPRPIGERHRRYWQSWGTYVHELGHVLGLKHTVSPFRKSTETTTYRYGEGALEECGLDVSYNNYHYDKRPIVVRDSSGQTITQHCERANWIAHGDKGTCEPTFWTTDEDVGNKFKAMLLCWNFRSFY